eukprot:scaffold4799_cov115-Isochrysis_galbana.AAC.3
MAREKKRAHPRPKAPAPTFLMSRLAAASCRERRQRRAPPPATALPRRCHRPHARAPRDARAAAPGWWTVCLGARWATWAGLRQTAAHRRTFGVEGRRVRATGGACRSTRPSYRCRCTAGSAGRRAAARRAGRPSPAAGAPRRLPRRRPRPPRS